MNRSIQERRKSSSKARRGEGCVPPKRYRSGGKKKLEIELIHFYQSERMAKVRLLGLKTLNGGHVQKARTDIL